MSGALSADKAPLAFLYEMVVQYSAYGYTQGYEKEYEKVLYNDDTAVSQRQAAHRFCA